MKDSADLNKQLLALVDQMKQELGVKSVPLLSIGSQIISGLGNACLMDAAAIAIEEMIYMAEIMSINIKRFQWYYNEYTSLKMEIYCLNVETQNTTVN